jgi:peptidylprolyl isomerase
MRNFALVFCIAAAVAAHAQTAPKPATSAAKPATSSTKSATGTAKSAAAAHTATSATGVKLPPGVPVAKGIVKTAFSLRYQDIAIGTGADAEPMKMYKVKYTGWRAADGVKFDSWDEHPAPVMDKDGKPEMDEDGKPKVGAPEPASFPVGIGRMIPGFDQGFTGMKVGGKRRLFVPWQLAYGTRAMPDHGADHPGIPAKSDLIFDIEIVDITDLPMPQNHPAMGGAPPATHPGAGQPGAQSAPSTPPPSGAPSTTPPPSDKPQSTPPPQK